MSAKRSRATRSLVAGVPALCRRARSSLLMYCDARERLRGLGFIRTDGAIAGQFGEWLAARCLRLQLAQSNVRKAYDAVVRAGQTFQIKARIVSVSRMSTAFDFRKPLFEFRLPSRCLDVEGARLRGVLDALIRRGAKFYTPGWSTRRPARPAPGGSARAGGRRSAGRGRYCPRHPR